MRFVGEEAMRLVGEEVMGLVGDKAMRLVDEEGALLLTTPLDIDTLPLLPPPKDFIV